jgi:hypothetical protein
MFENAHTFCSRIHRTMFGPAQLLLNWGEQWPSNQGELGLECHRGGWKSLFITLEWTNCSFHFCTVVGDCFGFSFK